MPPENFKKNDKKGVFACSAGSDRLALLPDRTVWSCEIFHTLLGHDPGNPEYAKYCFGAIEKFVSKPKKELVEIAANYADLLQSCFSTEKKELCGLCADLERCTVCPAAAALSSGILGVIPSWACRIQKTTRTVSARFHLTGE